MANLAEDINEYAAWVVNAFKADNYNLDYSINSLIEIDRFFQNNLISNKPKPNGRLSENLGSIIFAVSSYVAKTLIRNVPNSILITDDTDPKGEINFSVKLPNQTVCFPAQKTMKRVENGLEDGIYPYGYSLTKEFVNEPFNELFWQIGN
ncbi:hypothetical protein ASE40_06220 [Flavobacterium sp. Root935]|uniref:hypothetical protein n=1 Tax=unclassified Flavobacterium TaxID=196869 RepID=UPI00070E4A20|nr:MULTISPECIES: hypothetical protein [unclassified Flavobacterium]KRD61142.1 hypothetical protein ASE40_06220 [Flavobacterium sp. Root935]TDX09790.1 hypothetical protein EDB96_3377 [Flavobacterium sp. S87F.05.LMB.W.Kidney.N]